MSTSGPRDRRTLFVRLQVAGILAAAFALLLVYAFPGYMTSDSLWQLEQARSHHYTDWHPPAMAALWTCVELVVRGPAGMLVLQGALFVGGLWGVLRRAMSPRRAALVAAAVLVVPPVLVTMGCIWKDAQMAAFLMLGIALLPSEKRWVRIVGVLLLLIASAMRHNAAAATLAPLVLLFRWSDSHRWLKRTAIALAIWAVTIGGAQLINRALTVQQDHVWHIAVAPSDIVGVLRYSRPYSDAEALEVLDGVPMIQTDHVQEFARAHYDPYNWWWYSVSGRDWFYGWPQNDAQRAAISRAWWKLVRDNPKAYLLHRTRVFRGVIGATGDLPLFGPVYAQHAELDAQRQPIYREATGVQGAVAHAYLWLAVHTPLFRPYWYLLLALVLVPFARRHRLALSLLVSGILYELAYFPLAASADNRYSHWLMTTTVLGAVVLAAHWRSRRKALPATPVAAATAE